MKAVPCSLLRIVQRHPASQPAITDRQRGERSTFGEVVTLAIHSRRNLARLGLVAGNVVACDLGPGRDLAALLLACWESGLQLRISPAGTLGQAAAPIDLFVAAAPGRPPGRGGRQLGMAELSDPIARAPDPAEHPASATITSGPAGAGQTMTAAALLQTAANFQAAFGMGAGETLLSTSSPATLDGLCISVVIPLTLGLHVVLAPEHSAAFEGVAGHATVCEFSAPLLRRLLRDGTVPALPSQVSTILCGSGHLSPADRLRAEAALGRTVERGLGTPQTGFWAATTPAGPEPRATSYHAAIRTLRSPLRLIGAGAACTTGEIILRSSAEDGPAVRTGDVGWMTPGNTVEIAGSLADVSVRAGQAILLTDLDRLLVTHGAVRESRSFREQGLLPTEPVLCVCVTEASAESVRDWLTDHVGQALAPDRIVTLPPDTCAALPGVETLRSVATGRAGRAVIAALTARRFRRNPAYDEAGLAAASNAALLSGGKLEFLMFWGCGKRRHAAGPDRAAIDALGDLLAAAEAAAPLQAHAHVICTDLHATNNGHAESHFLTYFSEVRALAGGLDVTFELESAVWRRGGLGREQVVALEQQDSFEQRWQAFPLRDRFVQQASRHSRMTDKVAAARHYYATCLLERGVLKAMFGGCVFLTYNGPEFNECFPDLPTLYVYPGPRGPNDKPWFVELAERSDAGVQVAAE